jgi:DNA topoisomerase IB
MSTNESSDIPPPAQAIIAAFEEPDGAQFEACGNRVRLQHLARRLHALGERPLFHFIDEVERDYPLREHLEEYTRLDPNVVAALWGSHFGLAVFVIEGDGGHELA